MLGIRRHYRRLARRLTAGAAAIVAAPRAQNTTLLVVESIDGSVDEALWFARAVSPHGPAPCDPLPTGPERPPASGPAGSAMRTGRPPLEMLATEGGMTDAVLDQVWRLPRDESHFVTVVVPEQFGSTSLIEQFRRPHELALKLRLLAEPGVVVANVPVSRAEARRSTAGCSFACSSPG